MIMVELVVVVMTVIAIMKFSATSDFCLLLFTDASCGLMASSSNDDRLCIHIALRSRKSDNNYTKNKKSNNTVHSD